MTAYQAVRRVIRAKEVVNNIGEKWYELDIQGVQMSAPVSEAEWRKICAPEAGLSSSSRKKARKGSIKEG